MVLIFFWLKIFIKRAVSLVKSSPVLFVWVCVVLAAFIFAIVNRFIIISPDIKTYYLTAPFLLIYSILASFRNYNVTPVLMIYSKSGYSNNKIIAMFLIKKAFLNNLFLIILSLFFFNYFKDGIYFSMLTGIIIFSVLLSFIVMRYKQKIIFKKNIKESQKRSKFDPYIKSIFLDYLTPDICALFILCVSLFLVLIAEFTKDAVFSQGMGNQRLFFTLSIILFSVIFFGLIESITNINWRFHAVLSENSQRYHYKRTFVFLTAILGIFFIVFIIAGSLMNPPLLIKYIICLVFNMLIAVNLAFSTGNKIFKVIALISITAVNIWIVYTLPAGFLAVQILPAVITFIKAKNEYREWSLL